MLIVTARPRFWKIRITTNIVTLENYGANKKAAPATHWPKIRGTFLPKVSTIGPMKIVWTIYTISAILLAYPNWTAKSFSGTL